MFLRKTIPAYGNCDIVVATEQMSDGNWAVVASVRQFTETAQRTTDLPVPSQRFASQADAEDYGVRMAMDWIGENMPKVA